MPTDMDEESQVKLLSCLDEVRNIVGESASDQSIVDTVMRFNFDLTLALDSILSTTANAASTAATTSKATILDKGEYYKYPIKESILQ